MTKIKQKLESKLKKESDLIPPDGGWGWMIIVAAGLSNLSMLPMLQQFGLIFRDKFAHLGITSSETTTIINVNSALLSCVGLANGPLFKTFTYRQVSLSGAIIVFVSLLLTTFSYNFATYLVTFSILYGVGFGLSSSANALALNTYWKNRRRLATGLSWTATGLGPIIWPHIITSMLSIFGESGTILIVTGVSLHAIVCGLLLQPVEWHAKKQITNNSKNDEDQENLLKYKDSEMISDIQENGYFSQLSEFKKISVFSSQYLFNEGDADNTGYEITDPGVPMMLRFNDGYFSQSVQTKSKAQSREDLNKSSPLNSRLHSKKSSVTNLLENSSRKSSTLYLNESKRSSVANLGALVSERDTYKQKRKTSASLEAKIPESEIEDCLTLKDSQDIKTYEKAVIKKNYTSEVKSDGLENNIVDSMFEMYKDNENDVSHKRQEKEDKLYLSDNYSNQTYQNRYRLKSNNFNYESDFLKQASKKLEQYSKENEDYTNKLLTPHVDDNGNNNVITEQENTNPKNDEDEERELTFCQKVALFFDLDLLKDYTFVNLMLGLTLANFNEINFSILTPFILGDFGKSKSEVALYMSLLGGVDICVRFFVPFVSEKIGWDNNSFYLLGVIIMSMGRIVLAHCQTYYVVLLVAIIIGFGKGLRTVFVALIIPTYVPLHKLPGASGLQLLTAGVVFFALGPVVGWIKGNSSPIVILYCLNIFTWLTALSWGLEKYITAKQRKVSEQEIVKV